MVNIGTLTAFILVSIGVIVLRRNRPDLPRSFKVPLVPLLPILSAAICFYLTLNLSVETWLRFVIWMALGFIFYFSYGYGSRVWPPARRCGRCRRTPPGEVATEL